MTPGYKTTEFWLFVAAALVAALITADVFAAGSTPYKLMTAAGLFLNALSYGSSRKTVKAAAAPPQGFARPGALLALVLVAACVTASSGRRVLHPRAVLAADVACGVAQAACAIGPEACAGAALACASYERLRVFLVDEGDGRLRLEFCVAYPPDAVEEGELVDLGGGLKGACYDDAVEAKEAADEQAIDELEAGPEADEETAVESSGD